MKLFAPTIIAGALLASVVTARAQGVSMLNPMDPSYSLLSFVYEPPKGDGWRELAAAPDSVHLLYAETLGDTINTRADFTAQSFDITTAQKVQLADVVTLTRLSMNQRLQEKKDANVEVIAMAPPQQVTANVPMYEYTIVVKLNSEDIFEHYFVGLAPNKAEYLAAKMVTRDKEFREQPYYKALRESVEKIKFPGAAAPTGETKPPASDNTASAAPGN